MKTTIHTLKNEYKDNQTYLNEKQKLYELRIVLAQGVRSVLRSKIRL